MASQHLPRSEDYLLYVAKQSQVLLAGRMMLLLLLLLLLSHFNLHNQVRGHRTADSSHSGAEEYPREN